MSELLDKALAAIKKKHGASAVMRLGDKDIEPVQVVSTGSLGLDLALGVGGLPYGRIVEIFGPEASGKTSLTQHIIANVQRAGGTAAFIDAEHAFDPLYAQKCGVDTDKLLFSQPDNAEQALDIVEELINSGDVKIVVVDSVAALTPKAEIDGDSGDSHMGLQARLMGQALRKLTAITSKNNVLLIFINQLRSKIGVIYGSPETTTGGNALKFYASVRLDIRRVQAIKSDTEVLGNKTRVKVAKCKIAPPHKEAEFEIRFGEGIFKLGEILDLGTELGLIDRAGTWFSYKGERIGQGRDSVFDFLKERPEVAQDLETLIKETKLKSQNNG